MNQTGNRVVYRRWRVRHSYPRPVFDLVVCLIPIYGAAAVSRMLDIPPSVIYRWRDKYIDRIDLTRNAVVEVPTLATLVQRCAELGFRLTLAAQTDDGRARTAVGAPPSTSATPIQPATGANAEAADSAVAHPPSLLDVAARQAASDPHGAGTQAPQSSVLLPCSASPARRYVFDACRERAACAVRSRMEAVRDAIDRRYFLDVDCRSLAQAAGMSLHHFIRMFRDMFGLSPHQYLTRARVEAAKRLLLSSAEPIDVIAVGVGFRSGPSLSRAFKRLEGASVSRYCQTVNSKQSRRREQHGPIAGAVAESAGGHGRVAM